MSTTDDCPNCGPADECECSCECHGAGVDAQREHRRSEAEAHAYWSWYFGLTTADGEPTGRTIRNCGFTVAIEYGDAPGGWRYEMVGTVGR